MGTTSRGLAGTHPHGVRAIGVITLITLAASLLPLGVALAEPPAQAGSPGKPETLPEGELLAQAITFTLPATGVVGVSLALEGSADSALALDYRSETPRTCSIHQAVLELKTEGTCTISASQAGDDHYAPAADVTASIEIIAPPVAEPPAEPEPPGQAKERTEPDTPGQAEEKAKPDHPVKPEPPGQTKKPAEPEPKSEPEPPGQAEEKAKPEAPTRPEAPAKPDHPAKPEPPGQAEEKARPEPPGQAEEKARPEPPGQAEGGPAPTAPTTADGQADPADFSQALDPTASTPAAEPQAQPAADGLPILYIYPVNGGVIEPDSGTVQLTFRAQTEFGSFSPTVSFDWATADGSAKAPSDYVATSGTLTMVGWDTKEFVVTVNGDTLVEPDEYFAIGISNVTGAVYDAGFGNPHGAIWNDDPFPTFRIDGHGVSEGDGGTRQVWFEMTTDDGSDCVPGPLSFDWSTVDDTATAPSDYPAQSGTVTLTTGFCTMGFMVTINGDAAIETDERFRVEITNVAGRTYDAASSDPFGWIRNDDPLALTLIGDAADEGDDGGQSLWFDAHLSRPTDVDVTFDWATLDGKAIAPTDYLAASGTITIPAGGVYAEFPVTAFGDTDVEPDEEFKVVLTNVQGATYDVDASEPYGELWDDDGAPALTLNGTTYAEGNSGSKELYFSAHLSHAIDAPVTFDYATADDTAAAPADYIAETGTITIPAGQTTSPALGVTVNGDTDVEPDESFRVIVSNVVGATYDRVAGDPYGIIRDDDNPAPDLVVDCLDTDETDPDMVRGEPRTTEVKCWVSTSHPTNTPVTFDYRTVDGTATGGENPDLWPDYVSESGTVTLLPGTTRKYFFVTVVGDKVVEPDEYFFIEVSNVVGASFHAEDSDLTAMIVDNDDPTPILTVQSYEMDEGDSGTSELRFRATLSTDVHYYDITFTYATVDGTATSPSDYVSGSGTVTIPAGSRYSEYFTVTINGDSEVEFDEWFYVDLTTVEGAVYDEMSSSPWGDILNDDLPSISVDDITVVEGTGSDSIATFTVELSAPTQDWVSVGMQTVDGTATDGADYQGGGAGTILEPGYSGWLIRVRIIGDSLDEPDETFSLVVYSAMSATIADGTGVATIVDDDPPAAPAPVEPAPVELAPAQPAPADTTPPSVSVPTTDLATGALGTGATPVKLVVSFGASDPSGLASTALQHRTGSGAFTGVALAAGSATSALVAVGTSAKTAHQFQARATDTAGNTSPFAVGAPFRVKVLQNGASAITSKGAWATKDSKSAFGGSLRQAAKAGASQSISATAGDLAIVSTRGPDRGKARVVLDGKTVATLDLYSRTTKSKQVIYAVSFPAAGKHTLALVALGSKNTKATGTRVDLDAFLALTP